jgi:NAD+ diphosphatase
MPENFRPSATPPEEKNDKSWWFNFVKGRLLVSLDPDSSQIPFIRSPEDLELNPIEEMYLGRYREEHCYAAAVSEPETLPPGMALQDLRLLYGQLSSDILTVAFRAFHLLDWSRKTRFCGQCGSPMRGKTDLLAKECSRCGNVSFPKISPAVIVLVEREDQVLLARSPRFKDSFYSVLAGFVEPGETLEEVVVREVREETGIEVQDVRYFGSQPWPFPDSLMIAFTSRYGGGEIRVDGSEIMEARWFPFDQLPRIPGKISIARELIDWFVAKQQKAGIP